VLLNKQIDRKIDIEPDYKAFDIENEFVVGFGMDYNGLYRNLPYIGVLRG
jgi:hypoxanthine phosphoribosyltransferase